MTVDSTGSHLAASCLGEVNVGVYPANVIVDSTRSHLAASFQG